MKKILLIDLNNTFTADIERNIIINEYEDIEFVTRSNIDDALMKISSINPDIIVISCAVIMSANWNDYGIPVYSYAKTNNELLASHNAGIPCYGIIKKASELIESIRNNTILNIYTEQNNLQENSMENYENTTGNLEFNQVSKECGYTEQNYIQQPEYIPQNEYYQNYAQQQMTYNSFQDYNENYYLYQNYGYTQNQVYTNDNVVYQQNNQQIDYQNSIYNQPQMQNYFQYNGQIYPNQQQYMEFQNSSYIEPQTEMLTSQVDKTEKGVLVEDMKTFVSSRLNSKATDDFEDIAHKEFMNDMGYSKKRTKCITVYSAKGGVGKTTISCELATFLALTSHGRENFKVCIADFNIDFGDVLNTLSFDARGANMTTWAADIRDRINSGEAPEKINYPFARIRTWLQQNEKDNLFALLAPITNADSAEISELEIEVMLRNLIENCDFDFVICDTGNNTRDSSFIALERADVILLVLTQSVNTANCNNSFLATAHRIGFDMSKFKLIINKVKPAKLVGVSTDELENAFINPDTQKPYNFECLAKIKDNNDVASSNNLGEPLVYNSSHEFTKTIGEIVFRLLGNQTILKKPEKVSFFDKLFKKK